MMLLGIDPSQKTGWALYDSKASISSIKCGVLKANAKGSWEKGQFEEMAGELGFALTMLLKEIGRPDFAYVEKAPRQQYGDQPRAAKFMGEWQEGMDDEPTGKTGLQSILSTNQMAAALCGVLGACKIPYETVMPVTWRKAAYGFGTHKGWGRPEWKKHAREKCRQVRVAVTNDDMAEAAWIAFAAASSQRVKYQQARQETML